MIGFYLKFEVVTIEVGSKLLHKILTNLELLIKLVDLLDSLLVHGIRSSDFTELRTQVTQNEREYGNTNDDDEHGPNELILVSWQDISISYCRTGYRGPIDSCQELVHFRRILKPVSSDPINI